MEYLLSVVVICLTAWGQILLKLGARNPRGRGIANLHVISGYALFGAVIAISYYLMQLIPLKHFTVIMSFNYVAVVLAASLFLGEPLGRTRLLGAFLISVGAVIFTIQ
jgi:undecaprenyl phosphate-alpha-L-ara4N flippase subunit ArnE